MEPIYYCDQCHKSLNFSDLRARSEKLAEKAQHGQSILCLECQMDQTMQTKRLKTLGWGLVLIVDKKT